MNNYNKLQRKKSSPFAETPYFRLTPTFGRLVPYKKIYNFRGTLSHSLPRSVFEKTPLGTPKNFFRFVKAKPDGLSVFRAGTSSRLKRLGLFRSCRREASPKTQGLSEDASHHARKHKTPTEGTAHGVHRSVSQNQRFRHSGFFALPLKVCCPSAKKFSDRPLFQKGPPGCRAGPCKKHWAQAEALREALGVGRGPEKDSAGTETPQKSNRFP